jgi:hypothetical protein
MMLVRKLDWNVPKSFFRATAQAAARNIKESA